MSAESRVPLRTRIEGLVIFIVAIGYLWEAENVPSFYQMPGVPGPTTFPWVLGVVFALSGLWLAIAPMSLVAARRARAAGRGAAPSSTAPVPPPSPGVLTTIAGDWHFYCMWAAILAYLCSMPTIGFPVATGVLLAAFIALLGERRWALVAGLAVGITAVIYLLFSMGLHVRLPLGVLESLVKK